MNPTLKKAILFMVGAASMTKEKMDKFVKDLEAEGALNEDEGRELFKEMMSQSQVRATEISRQVRDEVKRALKEMKVKGNDADEMDEEDSEMKSSCECECECDCDCDEDGCKCEEGKDCGCTCHTDNPNHHKSSDQE